MTYFKVSNDVDVVELQIKLFGIFGHFLKTWAKFK
jgi:hypothetical protein